MLPFRSLALPSASPSFLGAAAQLLQSPPASSAAVRDPNSRPAALMPQYLAPHEGKWYQSFGLPSCAENMACNRNWQLHMNSGVTRDCCPQKPYHQPLGGLPAAAARLHGGAARSSAGMAL